MNTLLRRPTKHPVLDRVSTDYRDEIKIFGKTSDKRWAMLFGVAAVIVPWLLDADLTPPMGFPWSTWVTVINLTLLAAPAAAAFSFLVGYSGQLSFAHAGFLAIGSMSVGYFGLRFGLPLVIVWLLAGVVGALIGVVVGIPALRLRGPYLLLATMGVYFIALLAWKKFLLAEFGFMGMQVPAPQLPAWTADLPWIGTDTGEGLLIRTNLSWYFVLLPMCVIPIILLSNLTRSREGRAFAAVRVRDVSASLIGINVARTKLLAFGVSSAVVSMSGALSCYYLGARGEDSFPVQLTLNFAIMIVVGGFASIQGAVFGTIFYYVLPELTRWLRSEAPIIRDVDYLQDHAGEIDLLIFGLLVVFVLMTRPDGLSGLWGDIKGWFARWPFSN